MSCRSTQTALESNYRRYVRRTKLVRRFSEALRFVENLNDEAASKDCSANRNALGATSLDDAVFKSAEEYIVLLYIEAAAA